MAEKICSSTPRSTVIASPMDQTDRERKDVSKIFSEIRAKLNEKEKELLELQRAESFLFAPDADQIDNLFNVISSLHLSTADGAFLVPSSQENASSSTMILPSTGIQTIKTLPSNVWLNEKGTKSDDDTSALRLPVVSQLFSMSPKAFVASSAAPSVKPIAVPPMNDSPAHRLPMITELLSMPIDAFKPSKQSQSSDITTNVQILPPKATTCVRSFSDETEPKVVHPPAPPPETTVKSILEGDSVYSKDFWLKKKPAESTEESPRFDIEKYIEQTSEKMRRLHLEYVAALNQLESPPTTTTSDSTSTIKSLYPQVFDRLQPNLPSRGRSQPSSTTNK